MSSFALIIVLVLILTALGTLTLLFITLKYYWGERGKPPLSGDARRLQREDELRLRARQIEIAAKYPRATRKSSFWDNGKVYSDRERRN